MTEKPYKHALGAIQLLETTNYVTWKRQCHRILEGIRAWTIVIGEEQEPNNPVGFAAAAVAERAVYNDYMHRRAQAAAIISGSCCHTVQVYVEDINDPAEMWTVLATRMDTASNVVGRMTLLRKFHALRPIAGQPIDTYFSQLLEVKYQLDGSAQAISDAEFQNHICTTLPSGFDITVAILQARGEITIQQVMDALREREQHLAMTMVKPDAVSEALYTQQGGRGGGQRGERGGRGAYHGRGKYQKGWCDWCKTTTHTTANCWSKEKNHNNKRPHDQGVNGCYHCGEEGHTPNTCPARRKGNALRNSQSVQNQGGNELPTQGENDRGYDKTENPQ
jgi:hypothetical protein